MSARCSEFGVPRGGRRWAALAAALALVAGCGNQPTEVEDYDPEPVLSAFLTNGEPADEVYLERVAPLEGYYDPEDYGISGAEILIFAVDGGDTLTMVDDPDEQGHYLPPMGSSWAPEGLARYRIEARKAGASVGLWSETVVPDSFSMQILPPVCDGDTLTREQSNIVLHWTGADSAGGFILNVVCLTPEDSLVPLDPDFDPEEDEIDDEYPSRSATEFMRYDQRELTVPWYLFQWVGWHRVDLLAVTAEYYDYMTSVFRLYQGQPVELPSNVHGGLGILAGTSRNTFEVCLERAE